MTQTKENIVIVFLLAFVLACAYVLFGQNNLLSATKNYEKSIAQIIESKNTVRHRSANELVWRDVQKGIELYKSDQVFTHENASAVVKFNNGAELSIGPDALIKIEMQDKEAVISLAQGTLFGLGSHSGSLKVQTGKTELRLEGKDSRFQVASGGEGAETKIAVFGNGGNVKFGGKTYKLEKNQSLVQAKSGEVRVENVEIELVKPDASDVVFSNSSKPTNFAWRAPEKFKSFEIVIAKDRELKAVVLKRVILSNSTALKLDLPAGNYFWKVRSDKSESLVQFFQLKEVSPPWAVLPLGDQEIWTNKDQTSQTIKFVWESDVAATQYQIELAKDVNFKNIYKSSKNTAVKNISFENLEIGEYYWRIRQFANESWSPWGDIQHFSIHKPNLIPEAIYPIGGKLLPFEKVPKKIEFVWKKPTNAFSYKFYLSRDSSMEKLIVDELVNGEGINTNAFEPGVYFWKVSAYDLNGQLLGTSKIEKFVRGDPPTLAPPKIDSEFIFRLRKKVTGEEN